MSEWKEYRLGEIGTVVGGATPSTKNPSFYDGEIPWITPKDLTDWKEVYISKGERSITKEGYDSSSCKLMPKGTVLFTSRAPIGYIAIAANELCTNQGFKSIVPNNELVDSEFLYYALLYNKNRIKALGSGTTFAEISGKVMASVVVSIPDLATQKKIAAQLSEIDDKIAINRRICENLEAQAQALFKHWFIDFAPFKNGKFVESELGMIPEGWRVGTLEELGEIICGKTPPKANKSYYGGDVPFIKIPDMHKNVFILKSEDNLSIEGSNSQLNKLIPEFSIMVSCIATVGLVSMNVKPSHTNQQINTIVPYQSCYRYYIYENLKLRCKELLMLGSSGTTTYNINTRTFSSLKILVPELKIIEDFNNVIKFHFEKILIHYQENLRLSSLRDTLLPKLMSGEIKV